MTRIAITQVAFDAIVATMPFGNVGYEPRRDAQGRYLIWIERAWADKLGAMRQAGEDLSDVIVRIVAVEQKTLIPLIGPLVSDGSSPLRIVLAPE